VSQIQFTDEDRAVIYAPVINLESREWIDFFVTKFTVPQRMYTLVEVWNSSSQEDRVVLISHLVELLSMSSPTLSEHIKGGQEVLRNLDPSDYKKSRSDVL